MSHPFKVKSGAPSRHSVCGPSVGGTPPWISQRERREEKFVAPQLQLMKSPSINDECQTQQAVQPAKKTRIGCKPWSQQGSKHDVAQHCEGSQEQMSLCPFTHFPNCGGSHLRCRSSCFLKPPLTFGILGCMPCTDTGSGMTTEDILSDKGRICPVTCFQLIHNAVVKGLKGSGRREHIPPIPPSQISE